MNTFVAVFLGSVLLHWSYRHRQSRRDWNVGGICIGTCRSEIATPKEVNQTNNKVLFPHGSHLLSIHFDDDNLVSSVHGLTLVGPQGSFKSGDSFEKLRKKMGEPSWKSYKLSQFYRSELVIDVAHTSEEPRIIKAFQICRLKDYPNGLRISELSLPDRLASIGQDPR